MIYWVVSCHCSSRGLEVILGDKSHIFMFEQGGISQVGHNLNVLHILFWQYDGQRRVENFACKFMHILVLK